VVTMETPLAAKARAAVNSLAEIVMRSLWLIAKA